MKPLMKPLKLILILFLAANFLGSSANADWVSKTDIGKKTMAKFMVNLAKFVRWPDDAFADDTAPYIYCILGVDAFGSVLDEAMAGKQARKRSFVIKRHSLEDLSAAKACHVVFINAENIDLILPVIDELTGLPILTVGELETFAQYGGMIGFYGKGRKIGMNINKKRLEAGGLTGSSKLFRASTM